jgi:polygalacturonase
VATMAMIVVKTTWTSGTWGYKVWMILHHYLSSHCCPHLTKYTGRKHRHTLSQRGLGCKICTCVHVWCTGVTAFNLGIFQTSEWETQNLSSSLCHFRNLQCDSQCSGHPDVLWLLKNHCGECGCASNNKKSHSKYT